MSVIISFILFIIYLYYTRKILAKYDYNDQSIIMSDTLDEYYEMSPIMLYLVFVIVTAPIFLVPPFSLAKYAVYFIALILLLRQKRIEIPHLRILHIYGLFFIWLIICAFRGPDYVESIALLIKYFIPLLSLYLGYSALQCSDDIYYMLKYVLLWVLAYTFLIGGISAKFLGWFYYSPIGDQFLKYAGFADYLTALFIMPFIMVWLTGQKKWYWISVAMVLSSVLEVVRTGLGGMVIVVSVYSFCRFKWRSLPLLGGIAAIMLSVILFVPEVNQKFFGDKSGTVTANEIVHEDALSLDNIETNGRSFMWDAVMTKCYDNHELMGSGLGSAVNHLRFIRENIIKVPLLLHNDYVQIMCDTGLIGLGLLIIFFVMLFMTVTHTVWNTNNFYVKITGIMSISSMSGVAFAMGFDNVVSHSMTSLIIPFIFTGMFFKVVKLADYDNLFK